MAASLEFGDFCELRRTRWPLALTALGPALGAIGCGPPQFTALEFEIVGVAYDGFDTLTLTFSEPLDATMLAAVDPNDFRISAAQSYHWVYTDGRPSYQGTIYADVGYAYAGGRHTFASASLGAEDTQLVLRMSAPLGTTVCEVIAYYDNDYVAYIEQYYPGSSFEMSMVLHYAMRSIPITSVEAKTLEDIGPDWVLEPGAYTVVPRADFPKLDPKLEIPCP